MREINTAKLYLSVLKKMKNDGVQFGFIPSHIPIANNEGEGTVGTHAIFCVGMTQQSRNGPTIMRMNSLIATVFERYFKTDDTPNHFIDFEQIGMPRNLHLRVINAQYETPGYDKQMRAAILKVCGLKEIPHSNRTRLDHCF